MKNLKLSILLLAAAATQLQAQFFINGTTVFVGATAHLQVNENLTIQGPTTASILHNNGTIALTGNFENTGNYKFTAGNTTSTFVFEGENDATVNSKNKPFFKFHNKKSPGKKLTLLSAATVNGELRFFNDNTHVVLGSNLFLLGAAANIFDFGNSRYVVTNSTGQLRKLACQQFTFPVGADFQTYNPLIVNELGELDAKSVRCLPNVLSNGGSGSQQTSNVVGASWQVSEGVAGNSNATLTFQWAGSDELPGFDRQNCTVRHYSSGWTGPAGSAAVGIDPFTQVRSGVSAFGYFSVGNAATALRPGDRLDFANEIFDGNDDLKMEVFPNPCSDFLKIRTQNADSKSRLFLFDARGAVLADFEMAGDAFELKTADLPAAVYFIALENSGRQRLLKGFSKI